MIVIIIMAIFTGEFATISTIILAIVSILIYILINKIKENKNKAIKKDKKIINNISVGFYLVASNVITLLFVLLYNKLIG